MPFVQILISLLIGFSTYAQEAPSEDVILFVDKKENSAFVIEDIQKLQKYLSDNQISNTLIDIRTEGAPEEVAYTPCIVYRNQNGHQFYKGKHTTHKRLLNYIKTVRGLSPEPIDYSEKNVFVWQKEQAKLIFKIKITPPTGSISNNFNAENFEQKAIEAMKKGFDPASFYEKIKVGLSDELFYCNFYPYLSADGKIYISTELYSHYDCIHPIYKNFDAPHTDVSLKKCMQSAASEIFEEIKSQIISSEKGDVFYFKDPKTSLKTWDELPLPKLSKPQKTKTITNTGKINFPDTFYDPKKVDSKSPILTFNFPPPLRQYGGELKKIDGRIELSNPRSIQGMQGNFIVDVNTLDMGDPSLNHSVLDNMLLADQYPTASLKFVEVNSESPELEIGKITQATIKAELTLMDKIGIVNASAQFEPIIEDGNMVSLWINTRFTTEDLKGSYSIDGPDGPKDSNNRIIFKANFILKGISQ